MSGGVVVLLSGGLDSAVLATSLVLARRGGIVRALAVDYGQRHAREIESAHDVAGDLCIPIEVADLRSLGRLLPGSSQTDLSVPVPEGHYADASMRATVVPNRNMILLAVAAGHAIAHGCTGVAFAAHAGDHPVYPDCRPAFIEALRPALALCDYAGIDLLAPFAGLTKADIVTVGALLDAPMAKTWSCYAGGDVHCGKCGTCVERREAFALAHVNDPTAYEATP